jgi:hypothetical protein
MTRALHRRPGWAATFLLALGLLGPQGTSLLAAMGFLALDAALADPDCPTSMCTSRACCCAKGDAGRCRIGPSPCASPGAVLFVAAKGVLPPAAPEWLLQPTSEPLRQLAPGVTGDGFGSRPDPPPRSSLSPEA